MNTKTVLTIGFSIVIMVMIVLGSIGVSILHTSTQRIDTIVLTNNLKHNLIMRMRTAVSERVGHLQKMIIMDDTFDRDNEWTSFNEQGTEFIVAYHELRKMKFNPKEQVLLENEQVSINKTGKIQNLVASLAIEEEIDEARTLLLTKAIPLSQIAIDGLTKFMEIQNDSATYSVMAAKQEYRQKFILLIVLVGIGIVICFIIARIITRRISHAEQELKESHDILEIRVKERTEEYRQARDDADTANKAKSKFLSSMSHELRTPMNAILGFSQLLEIGAKDDSTKENIREVINAGDHLLELINELLDLAKIESGNVNLSIDSHNLNKLLSGCISIIKPAADKQSIQIDDKVSSLSNISINVDEKRFKQILLNILSNAIKYNVKNGKIIIECSPAEGNMLCLSVIDTGKGLTTKQKNSLFKSFGRVGAEYSPIEGTGLGLVISKDLIELMGGAIGIESDVGKGSRFWVKIPLS